MRRYLLKRMLTGLLMVIISVAINFVLVRLAPGDPMVMLAGVDNPNPAQIAALTEKFGLDKSIPEQFFIYVGGVLRGDFGYSYVNERPVLALIGERVGPTLMVTLTALIIAVAIGTLLGVRCARKSGGVFDQIICGLSYLFD